MKNISEKIKSRISNSITNFDCINMYDQWVKMKQHAINLEDLIDDLICFPSTANVFQYEITKCFEHAHYKLINVWNSYLNSIKI